MSRVNVDAQAYLDSRFGILGRLMGWGRAEFAIGMMSRIWLECTLRETDILSEAELGCAWGCDGSAAWTALRDSKLGDTRPMVGDMKMVRIKGCKGRTDWLATKRKAGKKGGKKSRKTPEAKPDSAYPESEADPKHESNTPAPAPAPAPAQKKESVGAGPSAPSKPRRKTGPTTKEIADVAMTVVGAFNECFDRRLDSKGSEDQIKRLLAKGYTEREMRGVMWWAGEEWGGDPDWRMKVSPTTVLKLAGNRTFPQYLALATELWRENENSPVPWERT